MFIYTKKAMSKLLNTDIEKPIYEVNMSDKTYLIKDRIYDRVNSVLATPVGKQKFSQYVGDFVNRNQSKLTVTGPVYLIPFTDVDKSNYYNLFNISEAELTKLAKDVVNSVNDKANWKLIKDNPFFLLLYSIIRYFTITKDSKALNNALILTALAFYPSIHTKYFKYQPNIGVMQYTIDNLSQRFIIKKTSHIFGTLTQSIQTSWKFHEKDFADGSDQACIRFIQRIRNDQNSLLKKIAQAYYKNYDLGLTVATQVDSYDDTAVVDNENNTNKVEALVNKIVFKMLSNGVDLRLCDTSSASTNVSRLDLRNYITKIIISKNSERMKSFIESILFIFLYDEKHEYNDINSMEFTSFALRLFKKSNSTNKNIINIKSILDYWGKDTGIYGKYVTREATKIDYTKAIYLYFILSIQKYN